MSAVHCSILAGRRDAGYQDTMQVLDLKGDSGASYRFRYAPDPSELPAHSGNFVLVRSQAGGPRILACGTRRSLQELAPLWPRLTADDARVYVRLNVSRTTRALEHDDLVAALAPEQILREPE